mgnify:CR=1 FL=1
MTCEGQGTLEIIVWKEVERVDCGVFVCGPFDDNCVSIKLIWITEMEDELPLICVNSGYLAIAEPDDMHLGCTTHVVFDLVLQLPIHENDFEKVGIHVPWRVKNNGIIGGHCKSVLHRGSCNRNTSNLYFLKCIGTFELVDYKVHLKCLPIKIAAYTNICAICHLFWVWNASGAQTIIPLHHFLCFKGHQIHLQFYICVSGANERLIVRE